MEGILVGDFTSCLVGITVLVGIADPVGNTLGDVVVVGALVGSAVGNAESVGNNVGDLLKVGW